MSKVKFAEWPLLMVAVEIVVMVFLSLHIPDTDRQQVELAHKLLPRTQLINFHISFEAKVLSFELEPLDLKLFNFLQGLNLILVTHLVNMLVI